MLSDPIANAASNFAPSFEITDELGQTDYQTMWEGKFDAQAGVTGIWMPRDDHMVVTNRGMVHHNGAMRSFLDQMFTPRVVMPWASNSAGSGWHLDVPSSAGGMTQVFHRMDLHDDIELWQQGGDITPEHLWPVFYTCYVLDIPPSTAANVQYTHSALRSADPHYHESETFRLDEAYTELRFAPGGLPEQKVDRSQYL